MKYYVEWAGKTRVVELTSGKSGTAVTVDGIPHVVDLSSVEGTGLHSLLLDDKSFSFAARFEGTTAVLAFHDREVRVDVQDERAREASRMTAGSKKATGTGDIKSVMPGVVKELRVKVGDAVVAKQPLLVLEAMKMENEIRADRTGHVTKVHVATGQAVEKGALLVTIGE